MTMLIDQVKDPELNKLGNMLCKFLPREILSHSINPISELLPHIMHKTSAARMIIMVSPPKKETFVSPDGNMMMQRMRSAHSSFLNDMGGPMMRHMMSPALGNMFPMHDPLQAMLSLLYAKGQQDTLGDSVVEGVIEPKAREVAGDTLVDEINQFINSVEKGTKEFIDTEEGKKVVVTVDKYSEVAKDVENSNKIQGTYSSEEDKEKLEDTNEKKSSIDNLKILNGIGVQHKIAEKIRKSGRVHTNLVKLSSMMEPFKHFAGVTGFINLLKLSISSDSLLTTADKKAQNELLSKLSDIFKNINGENVDEDYIDDLIYNTYLPEDEEEIMHIRNYPVDITKLNSLKYDEAKKALTESIANIIFDSEKKKVDIDKFKSFMEDLIDNQESASEKEEVADRVVDPILQAFTAEEELTEVDEGIGKDELEKLSNLINEVLSLVTPSSNKMKEAGF